MRFVCLFLTRFWHYFGPPGGGFFGVLSEFISSVRLLFVAGLSTANRQFKTTDFVCFACASKSLFSLFARCSIELHFLQYVHECRLIYQLHGGANPEPKHRASAVAPLLWINESPAIGTLTVVHSLSPRPLLSQVQPGRNRSPHTMRTFRSTSPCH